MAVGRAVLRLGEGWLLTVAEGLDAMVSLDAIGGTLALREVYHKALDAAPAG